MYKYKIVFKDDTFSFADAEICTAHDGVIDICITNELNHYHHVFICPINEIKYIQLVEKVNKRDINDSI